MSERTLCRKPTVRFSSICSDMSWFRFRRFRFQNLVPRVRFGHLRRFRSQPAQDRNIQGGIFWTPKTAQKRSPKPPKLKTSKTRTNKRFQELSLKPSYSSYRNDAHSRILAPKGPNRAKIEFSGPNVRVKIQFRWFWLHPVPVPAVPFGHPVPSRSGSKLSG